MILLIHGAGMDGSVWQPVIDLGVDAEAIDLPGHGADEGAPLASIEAMAQWLAGRLTVPTHLVGHSMGTYVALETARRRPESVASLTLCGTATAMPVNADLLAAADHDLPAAAAMMAKWGHARSAARSVRDAAVVLVAASRPGVLATDFRACVAYDGALDAAARLRCPVTVVVGLEDRMTPPDSGRAVAAAIAAATVVELPEVGHSMMTEAPEDVVRVIRATVTS